MSALQSASTAKCIDNEFRAWKREADKIKKAAAADKVELPDKLGPYIAKIFQRRIAVNTNKHTHTYTHTDLRLFGFDGQCVIFFICLFPVWFRLFLSQKSDRRVVGYGSILNMFFAWQPGQSYEHWPEEIKWICDMGQLSPATTAPLVESPTPRGDNSSATPMQRVEYDLDFDEEKQPHHDHDIDMTAIPAAAAASSPVPSKSTASTRAERPLTPHLQKLMDLTSNKQLCHHLQSSDDDDGPTKDDKPWRTSKLPPRSKLAQQLFAACDVAWKQQPHPGAKPHATRRSQLSDAQSFRSSGSRAKTTFKLLRCVDTNLHWALDSNWMIMMQQLDINENQSNDGDNESDRQKIDLTAEDDQKQQDSQRSHLGSTRDYTSSATLAAAASKHRLTKIQQLTAVRQKYKYSAVGSTNPVGPARREGWIVTPLTSMCIVVIVFSTCLP